MNRDAFETGSIYHVYNRGADKRDVFRDAEDSRRFLYGLTEYNDANPARDPRMKIVMPQAKLVEILCYCLMPNHFHLMVRQVHDGGITRFMRKLGTGYTMYFNKKHERSGVLFQGIFKSVLVNDDTYLRYLPHYIHLNPLELGVAAENLISYAWSSYQDYTSGRAGIAETVFLCELYAPESYRDALQGWLREKDTRSVSAVALD